MNKDLIEDVEALIEKTDSTHRYSMSEIYGLYNRIFKTNEAPQSCASCLIRKANELRKWVESEKSKELETETGIPVSEETDSTISQTKTNRTKGLYNKKRKVRYDSTKKK
jgi:hypothetical protein